MIPNASDFPPPLPSPTPPSTRFLLERNPLHHFRPLWSRFRLHYASYNNIPLLMRRLLAPFSGRLSFIPVPVDRLLLLLHLHPHPRFFLFPPLHLPHPFLIPLTQRRPLVPQQPFPRILVRPKAKLRAFVWRIRRPRGHATDVILIDGRIDGGAEFGAEVGAAVGAGFGGDAGAVLEQLLARDVEPVGGIGVAFDDVVGQLFRGEGGRRLFVKLLGGDGLGYWGKWVWRLIRNLLTQSIIDVGCLRVRQSSRKCMRRRFGGLSWSNVLGEIADFRSFGGVTNLRACTFC